MSLLYISKKVYIFQFDIQLNLQIFQSLVRIEKQPCYYSHYVLLIWLAEFLCPLKKHLITNFTNKEYSLYISFIV